MTTRNAPLATARSATRTTMGLPQMSASGFPGRRVDAQRAGIRTVNVATAPLGSSLRQLFALLRRQLPRFLFQHDRDPVANRVSEASGLRNQLLFFAIVDQRTLGHRADEHFKQLGIHEFFRERDRREGDRVGRAPADTKSDRRRMPRILPRPFRSSE